MRKLSMAELNRKSAEEFKQAQKNNIVVVLDNVRSMNNVGSVFRTADGFLIEKILLCGYTPVPPHRDINKTALGATESMAWQHFSETTDAVKLLKSQGYYVVAVEQVTNSVYLHEFSFDKYPKIALVFGNEVNGVSDEVLQLVDAGLEIPQYGFKHSFNISVTAAMVLWQALVHKLKR
jgi:23S rRNA (guanosine2251-2'-O)-methyltransferase